MDGACISLKLLLVRLAWVFQKLISENLTCIYIYILVGGRVDVWCVHGHKQSMQWCNGQGRTGANYFQLNGPSGISMKNNKMPASETKSWQPRSSVTSASQCSATNSHKAIRAKYVDLIGQPDQKRTAIWDKAICANRLCRGWEGNWA